MWRATIKGLLAHKVRLGLTALAVVLGVAFVSGTFILTDTMNKASTRPLPDDSQTLNQGVAVVVQGEQKFKGTGQGGETAGPGERVPASVLDGIRTVPGVEAAEGELIGYAQVVGTDGKRSPRAAHRRSAHRGFPIRPWRSPPSDRATRPRPPIR